MIATNKHDPVLESLDRVAALHQHTPGFARYASAERAHYLRVQHDTQRFARRLAESTELIGLLSFADSTEKTHEWLREIAEYSDLKIAARPAALFMRLARVEFAIVVVALKQSAPAGMFRALLFLPLILLRFAVAKAQYAVASRRARGATR